VADPLRTVFIWQTNEELGFTQVPVSIAFVRLLSSQLEGIAAAGGGGPLTFVAVSLVLLAVAQIASLVPAWRSVKVDPVAALRMD
jgi:ABC-type antimicrobial peptide transport system permease subunit